MKSISRLHAFIWRIMTARDNGSVEMLNAPGTNLLRHQLGSHMSSMDRQLTTDSRLRTGVDKRIAPRVHKL